MPARTAENAAADATQKKKHTGCVGEVAMVQFQLGAQTHRAG